MTTISSAEKIASLSSDPMMGKAAKIAFGRCGNCLKRVKCTARLIDIPRAFKLISEGKIKPRTPHRYVHEAAKIFKGKCAVCDQLGICILTWANLTRCPGLAPSVTAEIRELGKKDVDTIAAYLEGLLHHMNLTPLKLTLKVGRMWWKCDKDESYVTLVGKC